MITTQALIEKFRQALNENWGYIWGTSGEKWTEAKQAALEKTADPDRAQGRAYGSKWIGHQVADCSGLFSWAFKELGGYMYHGSDTMYRKYCTDKGELKKGKRADGGTLKPGTAVFVWNGKKYSHVGLYAGDGTVIEAMSTISGVTTSKVAATKWTHWGELTGVEYAGRAGNEQLTMNNEQLKEYTTIRRGSKGQAVRDCQAMLVRLGYDVGSCGIDGDFGKDTEKAVRAFQKDHGLAADGVVGKLTFAELEKAAADPVQVTKRYSITITGLELAQAKALQQGYPGSVIEEVSR